VPGLSSSDAAGATAVSDNSHGSRTALPCPSVDGRVLRERDLSCVCEECRLAWLPADDRRWRAYWNDDGPEEEAALLLPRVREAGVRSRLTIAPALA
jgi:hypothetical protein